MLHGGDPPISDSLTDSRRNKNMQLPCRIFRPKRSTAVGQAVKI